VSENWHRTKVGLVKEIEAIPISPLALPRPSTIETKRPGVASANRLVRLTDDTTEVLDCGVRKGLLESML